MTDHDRLTRRDFLVESAFGALGLSARGAGDVAGGGAQPAGELLFVGTYTERERDEGIFLVRMDPRTGELRRTGAVRVGANPSFLAIHPNGRVLYAVNEVTELAGKATGAVSAFAIDRGTGGLTRLNRQPSEGGAPCYVSVDRGGRLALVANYVGGSVVALPIRVDGSLAPRAHVVRHRGSGPNAERQEAPHAHCIVPDPSGRYALAADLGIDRVLVYRLDPDAGRIREVEQGGARMRPGAGPRHLAFHPDLPVVFVANELDSTVTALRFDAERGALSALHSHPTLPEGWSGENSVADIHVAPSGRTVYVSNRGHDSIAVLSVAADTGALALEQVVPSEGHWPRNFSLDPTGRWLLVANQRSNSIVAFGRDPESGRLSPAAGRLDVPRPVCLRFLAHAGTTT